MGAVDLALHAASILPPAQLPPILSLGTRDDASFSQEGDTWSCLYRFEGEPFALLGWDGRMWEITRFWQGRKLGVTHAPANLTLANAIALHYQYLSVDAANDPYEKLLKERTEAAASVQYWLPEKGESMITTVPGGRIKGMVFPLSRASATNLEAASEALSLNFGARLLLTRGERRFQFVTLEPPEEITRDIVAALSSVYDSPVSQPRIAHMDVQGRRIWRIQLSQEVDLAYIALPEHGLLALVNALSTRGYLAPRLGAPADTMVLILFGALVAGAAEIVGQTSV